jgi:uncharacterized protein YeaO (DUF488 family)
VIKAKRVYAPVESSDGRRFLVDRIWPRGIRKDAAHVEAWLKDAGPSDELRKWFGHDPARWAEFKRRYRRELNSRRGVLQPLVEAAQQGDITLVYSARDEEHNQAVVLKSLLEELLTPYRGR